MLARNVQREIERDLNLQSKAAMANSDTGTSSGSAGGGKYQVFLNFCGRDTRDGFTSFLHRDLVNNGIRAFMDDEEIRVGEEIGGELLRAIDDSQIYVPIFSKNYASRKWCLLELVRMVDNLSKSKEKKILPIFLYVEPDDLKTESYRKAIGNLKKEHEKKQRQKFPHEVESWKLESWEKAPTNVVKNKGWVLRQHESQAIFVDKVVEALLQELKIKYKSVTKDLVGLDHRVEEVLKLLDVDCKDQVGLLGIYGMGGIGKTTLAKIVYDKLCSRFGNCCAFLADIRETSKKKDLVSLQKKLLTAIGNSSASKSIHDVDDGRKNIGEIIGGKEVLVVFDDIGEEEQIKNLIGQRRLHRGTRVIITTRNIKVVEFMDREMKEINSDRALQILTYEMKGMESCHAIELFKMHAFRGGPLAEDFDNLSVDIVNTTGSLPLALEVIGSLLYGKPKAKWESTLKQLRKVPHKDVQKTLMISYKDLNYRQREIFLDIACFFINEDMTNANYMWEACGFYPNVEIDVLVEMSLINIKDNGFWMHDQLRDLGREIVCQKSPTILGRRSRLWTREEVLDLVRTKQRKEKVEAIDLRGSSYFLFEDEEIENEEIENEEIKNEEIERFESLRFLRLSNVTLDGNFAGCLPMLKWISWSSPLRDCSVVNMHLKNLVVLEFFDNHFEDDFNIWDSLKMATKLKNLTLVYCYGITRTPDLSECQDLERLTFVHCKRLEKIHDSIGKLKCLLDLNIADCELIERVPDEIGGLVKLERFSLNDCDKVSRLPTSIGDLASLRKLDLSSTRITSLPKSIKKLQCLSDLCLNSTDIRQLPNSIGKLTSLCTLDMSTSRIDKTIDQWEFPKVIGMLDKLEELYLGHREDLVGEIPDEIGHLSSLKVLDLCSTKICRVPGTIDRLFNLSTLDLTECDEITELPELPKSLVHLRITSNSLQVVPNLSNLTNIVELVLSDGSEGQDSSKLKHTHDLGWIDSLSKLKKLKLCLLNIAVPPTKLGALSVVEDLTLLGLDLQPLEQLPPSLRFLELDNFSPTGPRQSNLKIPSNLTLRPSRSQEIQLHGFSQLQHLNLNTCQPQSLSIASSLRRLTVFLCPKIEIQVPGMSASLKELCFSGCESIGRIVLCGEGASLGALDQSESSSSESTYRSPGILLLPNALKKLELLHLLFCNNLLEIQIIGTLLSLQRISIDVCDVEKLTGLSNLKNLCRLFIRYCFKLRVVEGLDKLEFLTELHVEDCPQLETLLDISNSKISNECNIYIQGCRNSLDSLPEDFIPFKRYKKMKVQQGAPQSETNKKAKMEGDAEEPNTELQLQFHLSTSSWDHEINEEPPIDDVGEGTPPGNQNQTRE